jgi:hypothetical protein
MLGQLAAGRHLRSGAAYEDGTVRVTVREWDGRRAVRAGLLELEGALKSVDRPRLIEVRGRSRAEAVTPLLSAFGGAASLRLDEWWAAMDGGRPPPPPGPGWTTDGSGPRCGSCPGRAVTSAGGRCGSP